MFLCVYIWLAVAMLFVGSTLGALGMAIFTMRKSESD
jgi:hypothetical protein